MRKIVKNPRKGTLIWITGLSGSGKTSLAHSLKNYVENKNKNWMVLSGDDIRKNLELSRFDKVSRLKYALLYSKICKKITDRNINIIFSTVSLFKKVRSWNKKNIDNYLEIYIKSNIQTLIGKKQKFFYRKKLKNIVGKNIEAEFPKNPDIVIENNFKKSLKTLSGELIKKINF